MRLNKFIRKVYLLILFTYINLSAKNVEAELITNVKSIQPGKEFWVALKLTAKQDWHTYWRNPGDSGLPTTIDWNLPEGFIHSEIQWTYPEVFIVEGIANFGYDKEELLLIKITPPKNLQTNKTVTLKAKASWLACRVECVPEEDDLSLTIPVKNEKPEIDNSTDERIKKAIDKLPAKNYGLKLSAELKENSLIISCSGDFDKIKNVRFFPYEAGYYNHSAEQKLIQKENRFTLQIPLDDFKIANPENAAGILFFENGLKNTKQKSIEINLKLTK